MHNATASLKWPLSKKTGIFQKVSEKNAEGVYDEQVALAIDDFVVAGFGLAKIRMRRRKFIRDFKLTCGRWTSAAPCFHLAQAFGLGGINQRR